MPATTSASASPWGNGPPLPIRQQRCAICNGITAWWFFTNVDHEGFRGSAAQLGVPFAAVYTAQDIGSYKPDPANFPYLLHRLAELGYGKHDVLHVAQSLYHDHAPAQDLGLATAWIDRRNQRTFSVQQWGATMPPVAPVRFDYRFPDLAAMVQAHQEKLARHDA